MNPWYNLFQLLGWGLLAVSVVVIGVIIYIVIMVGYGVIKDLLNKRKR